MSGTYMKPCRIDNIKIMLFCKTMALAKTNKLFAKPLPVNLKKGFVLIEGR